MSEQLFTVQCRLRMGAGIRGGMWSDNTAHLTEGEAEKLCRELRLSTQFNRDKYLWRIVPMGCHMRFRGAGKLPNAAKGLQRAFRAAREIDMEQHTGFDAVFTPTKGGGFTIRMGGGR